MEKTINHLKENLAFYLTIVLLVWIPLYPKFPLFEIFGTYIAVRLEDFVLAIAFALWIIVYFRDPKEFFNNSLNRAVILFLAIGAVSLFSGLYLTKSIEEPHLGLLHYLRRVEYFLPFFIAVTAIKKREHLNSVVVILGIVIAATTVYGVGQKLFSWPVISTMNKEFSKGLYLILTPDAQLNSTFAGHYDLAAFTAMMLPLFVILFIDRKRLLVKIICFLLTGTLLWLLLASASRISFAAALVGILSALWISSRKKFVVPAVIFAVMLLFTGKDLLARFAQTWYSLPSAITVKFPLGEKIAQKFAIQRTHPGYKIDPEVKDPTTATASAGKIAVKE
ncbi:MAG: hypothetical protein Q8N98_02655, partial [bacterium]|nr:hypothetical protein [bacterium]